MTINYQPVNLSTNLPKIIPCPESLHVDVRTCLAYDKKGFMIGPAMRSGDQWYVIIRYDSPFFNPSNL